jgi:hypothetical protein
VTVGVGDGGTVAVAVAVAVAVGVGVGVGVNVAVAVVFAVGVGLGQAKVYRTFKPSLSAAVPHEKVVAGPVLLACAPVVSSMPLSELIP